MESDRDFTYILHSLANKAESRPTQEYSEELSSGAEDAILTPMTAFSETDDAQEIKKYAEILKVLGIWQGAEPQPVVEWDQRLIDAIATIPGFE